MSESVPNGEHPQGNSEYGCTNCGSETHEDVVKIAMWDVGTHELIVVTDVPVRVCEGCAEQFYSDVTRISMDQLKMTGGLGMEVQRTIQVPVFSLNSDTNTRESD